MSDLMSEPHASDALPPGLRSGLEDWADAVRRVAAQAPEFRCVLPAPDAETGFDIAIERAGGQVTATFGGLIHDCDRGLDEAFWWIAKAYSPGWQLRVERIDGRPVTFTLENAADPTLGSLSSGYVSLFGRWRQRENVVHVNARRVDPEVVRELQRRAALGEVAKTAATGT